MVVRGKRRLKAHRECVRRRRAHSCRTLRHCWTCYCQLGSIAVSGRSRFCKKGAWLQAPREWTRCPPYGTHWRRIARSLATSTRYLATPFLYMVHNPLVKSRAQCWDMSWSPLSWGTECNPRCKLKQRPRRGGAAYATPAARARAPSPEAAYYTATATTHAASAASRQRHAGS